MRGYKYLHITLASIATALLTAQLSKGVYSQEIVEYNAIYSGVTSLLVLTILSNVIAGFKKESK